jgi:hypothetical protein
MYLAFTSQSPPNQMACTSHVPGFGRLSAYCFPLSALPLWWLWGGFGGALGWPWGGLGVALGCLSVGYQQALGWLWPAFPGRSAIRNPHSALTPRRLWAALPRGFSAFRFHPGRKSVFRVFRVFRGQSLRPIVRRQRRRFRKEIHRRIRGIHGTPTGRTSVPPRLGLAYNPQTLDFGLWTLDFRLKTSRKVHRALHPAAALPQHAGVNHGRGHIIVPKKLLNRSDVADNASNH